MEDKDARRMRIESENIPFAPFDKNPVIENNFKYHSPKEGQQEKYTTLRDTAKELAHLIDRMCPMSREKSLATTKLEESIMWANASIARNE